MQWLEKVDFSMVLDTLVNSSRTHFGVSLLQPLFDCSKKKFCVFHPLPDLRVHSLKIKVWSFIHLVDQQTEVKTRACNHVAAQECVLVYQLLAGQQLKARCVLKIKYLCTRAWITAHTRQKPYSAAAEKSNFEEMQEQHFFWMHAANTWVF